MNSPLFDLVVFDLDGVLANLDRAKRLAYLSATAKLAPEFVHAAVWNSDFEISAEQGAYPHPVEYLAEFNRRIGFELSREDWVAARRDAMTLNVDTLRIAAALNRSMRIAMLTNNGSLLKAALGEIVPQVAAIFGERAHASFEFAARKPDTAVFRRILELYEVEPLRAIFIDDDSEYIAGADEVGMHGILFTNAGELAINLRTLGLSID